MYKELSEFELCLELLTQVKNGNRLDSDLKECTRLSQTVFDQIMEPLLIERLVTKNLGDAQSHVSFNVTDKGEQFIDFLTIAFNYVESQNDNQNSEPNTRL